ncbi:hypothetical protein pEp_SNUABM10_00023 [Erwinia phage pEp_SNUABM_10]|uniref:DUF5476 domain-containing protein n=1 Tax=Erwinia phage pEp_SNUABM_09 TaxID=2601644 RepID=A0A5J6DA49_9CAUD|nr:DUF5476 domain-containing protein [Erwinia phage pEp_SNUABM_09]QOC57622.1 hypothetical protein pEp_SNUABM03_00020 [Erwinia phage pEp_SNUABM_03]QOC57677.1 hypothetical protein pEp_SNUABM04_00023 [Erwinia phage pEp_SNUABM_04]QOC57727.1 hypothetical protein pEp_SNUABM10_00023 [Erwinia phage pEp_SNUABM_10]QOC57780.1 hypothetical protein pEp_SNUABM11_00024 [Erwinia phage pEp_SNUABM_11]
MCFSAKVKTPKVDTNQVKAAEPAPLTEEPKGVLFGGEDEDNSATSAEVSTGRKSLKVDSEDKPKTGIKASIRKTASGK